MGRNLDGMPPLHVEEMGTDQEKGAKSFKWRQGLGHVKQETLDGLKPFQEMTKRSCGYCQRRACHTTAVMCTCDSCAVGLSTGKFLQ